MTILTNVYFYFKLSDVQSNHGKDGLRSFWQTNAEKTGRRANSLTLVESNPVNVGEMISLFQRGKGLGTRGHNFGRRNNEYTNRIVDILDEDKSVDSMTAKYESQKSGLLADSDWIQKAQSISEQNECPQSDPDGDLDQSGKAGEETGELNESADNLDDRIKSSDSAANEYPSRLDVSEEGTVRSQPVSANETFDDVYSEFTETSKAVSEDAVTVDDSEIRAVEELTKFFETAFVA